MQYIIYNTNESVNAFLPARGLLADILSLVSITVAGDLLLPTVNKSLNASHLTGVVAPIKKIKK